MTILLVITYWSYDYVHNLVNDEESLFSGCDYNEYRHHHLINQSYFCVA